MSHTSEPLSGDDQYSLAKQFLAEGKRDEAQRLLEELVSQGVQRPEPYADLGAIALQNEDSESAKEYLKKALEIDPGQTIARRFLAFLYGLDSNFDQAFATISPLLRIIPPAPEDIELVKNLLEATPKLSPITWARLLADLKTPSAEVKKIIDKHNGFDDTYNKLCAENKRLQDKINELTEELRLSGNTGDAWERVHRLSIDEWQDALIRSVDIPSYKGFPLPGFPSDALQTMTVGSSNQWALMEGFNFYRSVKSILERNGHQLNRKSPLLDFGTGWGRYARIFMRDVHPDHITGVDVMPNMVDTCKSTFPYATFKLVPSLPPSDLPANTYQLIVAYSVFSHLSEAAATAWIREFSRILAPGGMIAITTQGRRFLSFCEDIRKQGQFDHPWHANLARSFVDRAACEAAYDRGEYLFSATGGGDALSSSFYGETLIPQKFVEDNWASYLDLVEFKDDGQLPQALIVMRKPA
ncbi:MAG: methyltransferase domain-containing protein [Actinomycetota bacterium]